MRLKIIAVFSLIVVVLGVLGWVVAGTVGAPTPDPQIANRALQGGVAQLQLEGAMTQRWLMEQASKVATLRDPLNIPENQIDQRGTQAASECDKLFAAAQKEIPVISPSFVALVNPKGVTLGRSNSTVKREDFGKAYPTLIAALEAKVSTNDVWIEKSLGQQHLASIAPILDADGRLLGGIVITWLIDDAHLTDTSVKTSGRNLALVVRSGSTLTTAGTSDQSDAALVGKLTSGPTGEALAKTSGSGENLPGLPGGAYGAARTLEGFGEAGKQVLLVALVPAPPSFLMKLILPFAGVLVFALVLVGIAGYILGGYIMRPVTEIEEGLLGIINGQTNRRFELEHAELGGVVSHLNSLLNQLFGVTEDDTDEEGRPSHAPDAKAFKAAIEVDEKMVGSSAGGSSSAEATALKTEPESVYQDRIFKEYIAAKRQVGDPTDHITREDFLERIAKSEAETEQKTGKPVRYKVEVKGKEVQLIAIPLG
ncbi:MAG: MXAN_5187 C-terminal domain-containing protein [Polyangiaceae bacterium]